MLGGELRNMSMALLHKVRFGRLVLEFCFKVLPPLQ